MYDIIIELIQYIKIYIEYIKDNHFTNEIIQ